MGCSLFEILGYYLQSWVHAQTWEQKTEDKKFEITSSQVTRTQPRLQVKTGPTHDPSHVCWELELKIDHLRCRYRESRGTRSSCRGWWRSPPPTIRTGSPSRRPGRSSSRGWTAWTRRPPGTRAPPSSGGGSRWSTLRTGEARTRSTCWGPPPGEWGRWVTDTMTLSSHHLYVMLSDGPRDSRLGQGGQRGHQLRAGVPPELHPANRRQLEEPVLGQDVPHLCPAGDPGPEHAGPHLPAAQEGGEPQVLQGDGLQGGRPHPAEGEGAEVQPGQRGAAARQMCHLLGTRMGWLLWTDRIHNKRIIYLQGTNPTKTQLTNTNNAICKRFQLADRISSDWRMYKITFWHSVSVTGQAQVRVLLNSNNPENVNISPDPLIIAEF